MREEGYLVQKNSQACYIFFLKKKSIYRIIYQKGFDSWKKGHQVWNFFRNYGCVMCMMLKRKYMTDPSLEMFVES